MERKTSDAQSQMHNCSPQADQGQIPFLNPDRPHFQVAALSYTGHDVLWYGISLWSVQVSRPGCAPSQDFFLPQW